MENMESKKVRRSSDIRYYFVLACVMLVFVLLFQPITVQGTSMENTLVNGDFLIVWRDWLVEDYIYGDIVVASKDEFHNGELIIKRVIAVEGQVVDIDPETGTVYVDGEAMDEPYVSSPTNIPDTAMFPLTVEDDCYFVLGDNRSESVDSRYQSIGLLHSFEIKGKVLCLVLPGQGFDLLRIGSVD